MSLQDTLKTLEALRAEAQTVRDRYAADLRRFRVGDGTLYDHWAGREMALREAIEELTKGVRPISREKAGFPDLVDVPSEELHARVEGGLRRGGWLGDQLERDHARHRTVESDLKEDR